MPNPTTRTSNARRNAGPSMPSLVMSTNDRATSVGVESRIGLTRLPIHCHTERNTATETIGSSHRLAVFDRLSEPRETAGAGAASTSVPAPGLPFVAIDMRETPLQNAGDFAQMDVVFPDLGGPVTSSAIALADELDLFGGER